jgi:hypothetical protein
MEIRATSILPAYPWPAVLASYFLLPWWLLYLCTWVFKQLPAALSAAPSLTESAETAPGLNWVGPDSAGSLFDSLRSLEAGEARCGRGWCCMPCQRPICTRY